MPNAGSGGSIGKLGDGTRVVGTPDNDMILYVDWKKADGTTERLVGAAP